MNAGALYQAVQVFVDTSKPTNSNGSAPCTVRDINRVVDNLAVALNEIIAELESE